eukprot:scaffold55767_cov36-Cyclotella_meneghiniana.AAC.2
MMLRPSSFVSAMLSFALINRIYVINILHLRQWQNLVLKSAINIKGKAVGTSCPVTFFGWHGDGSIIGNNTGMNYGRNNHRNPNHPYQNRPIFNRRHPRPMKPPITNIYTAYTAVS